MRTTVYVSYIVILFLENHGDISYITAKQCPQLLCSMGFVKVAYLKFYYSQEFWGCEMLIFTKANKVGLETLIFLQSLTFRELGFGPGNPIDTDIQRGARRRSLFSLKLALLRVSLPPLTRARVSLRGIGGRSFNLWTALRCNRKDASQVGSLASGGSLCPSHWYVSIRVHFPSFSQLLRGLFLHLCCLISWADTVLVRKS